MKIEAQQLRMIPLATTLLVAGFILAVAIWKPQSSKETALPTKSLTVDIVEVPAQKEAQSSSSTTLEDLKSYMPQNKEGHFEISVANLFYTKDSLDVHRVLATQTIETTGQITYEVNQDSEKPLIKICDFGSGSLFRPARYSVVLEFDAEIPHLKHRGWVRLVGKPIYKRENGKLALSLSVIRIEAMSAPRGK
jgi:hypothetical protein